MVLDFSYLTFIKPLFNREFHTPITFSSKKKMKRSFKVVLEFKNIF